VGSQWEYNDPIQDDWARRPAAIGLETGPEKLPKILPAESLPWPMDSRQTIKAAPNLFASLAIFPAWKTETLAKAHSNGGDKMTLDEALLKIYKLKLRVEKLQRERLKLLGRNGESWRQSLAGTRFTSRRVPR
jgi:hypothetical protein